MHADINRHRVPHSSSSPGHMALATVRLLYLSLCGLDSPGSSIDYKGDGRQNVLGLQGRTRQRRATGVVRTQSLHPGGEQPVFTRLSRVHGPVGRGAGRWHYEEEWEAAVRGYSLNDRQMAFQPSKPALAFTIWRFAQPEHGPVRRDGCVVEVGRCRLG